MQKFNYDLEEQNFNLVNRKKLLTILKSFEKFLIDKILRDPQEFYQTIKNYELFFM